MTNPLNKLKQQTNYLIKQIFSDSQTFTKLFQSFIKLIYSGDGGNPNLPFFFFRPFIFIFFSTNSSRNES